MKSIAEVVAKHRVVICAGSGGVGKTTTAAALAVHGAEQGRRTMVMTIDPARRLADALGLRSLGNEARKVRLGGAALEAMMLDQKGAWDALVERYAPSEEVRRRILANRFYQHLSESFAGSQEYMAIEQLAELHASDRYDLIVVDTPPASHALELFDAPERILALLDSRALEYLGEPMRILGGASSRLARGLLSAVLAGLERMTGLSLLSDISALATDFGAVVPGFRERARAIRALLRARDTRYVLLAAPDPHATRDLVAFAREVDRAGVSLDAVVVNRVLSFTLEDTAAIGAHGSAAPSSHAAGETAAPAARRRWSATLARHLVACAKDLDALRAAQRGVIEGLREGLTPPPGSGRDEPLWVELPALSPAPTTLAGIVALARAMAGVRARSTSAA